MEILLQRGASLITKHHSYALLQRGKRYYKVEQLIRKWGNHYYTEGHVLQKSPLYYKVGQSLLQCGVGTIKWGNFIVKWETITEKTSTSS